MKFKKNTFLLFLFAIFFAPSFAQEKPVETSHKKEPKWLHGTEVDYIITTGRGESIDKAKEDVMKSIQDEIVNSVAIYVRSKTEMNIENTNNNGIINTIEKMKNTSTVQTADIPSLKGISLNKVSDFYWEKFYDKKTKVTTVAYHVKYPYTEDEREQLIREFKKKDDELTQQLNDILDGIEEAESIETLEEYKKQLEYLSEYFIDQRKEKADLGVIKLKDMLASVELVPISTTPGEIQYTLKIGDNFYACADKPKYEKTDCVIITSKESSGHVQTIKFTYDDCSEDEKNFIKVIYKFANKKVENSFYFDMTSEIAEVFLKDDIIFKALKREATEIKKYSVAFNVVSKYETAFEIEKIVMEWTGLPSVTVDINKEYSGKGSHNIVVESDATLDNRYSSKNKSNISGVIYYKNAATGEVKRHKFFSQKINTDW